MKVGAVDDKRDNALGDAIKAVLCRPKHGTRRPGKTKRITPAQLFQLVRRWVILVAAVWYMLVSIQGSVASMKVLKGVRNPPMKFEAYHSRYILDWVGKSTIRTSPLVMHVLKNDTTVRNFTIYLEADGVVSTKGCALPNFKSGIYGNAFLRLATVGWVRELSFNVTELATHLLIAPVVDCSFLPITRGEDTIARAYFLWASKTDPEDVFLQSARFSMQDYKVREMNEYGPVGLNNHQFIRDMSRPVFRVAFSGALGYPFEPSTPALYTVPFVDDQGWWVMTNIPPKPTIAPKRVVTSRRTGFYVKSDSEQANIKNLYWGIGSDPVQAVSEWNWKGEPTIKDSWAWVHLLHVGFALDSLANLLLLFTVMYRNFQKGKIWIGDAFVSVSSTLAGRSVWITVSLYVDRFWSFVEFCLHDAHKIANTQVIVFHVDIMRADLLTLFLGAVSTLGYVTQERIDPAFTMIVFQICFSARFELVRLFPSLVATITQFAQQDNDMAVMDVSEKVAYSSPLRLWTTHTLPAKDLKFIGSCLSPFLICSSAAILLYVAARKVYRFIFHEKVYKQGHTNSNTGTDVSAGSEAALLYKRNLTLFEIATGAELQNRYGVVSDYENFLIIKGMKYASADGIYSSGFVIANGKFLVGTADIWLIAFQKLTGIRLRSISFLKWTATRSSSEPNWCIPNRCPGAIS